MSAQERIPPLIHQTWKDSDIPAEWQEWADSWRLNHPDWGYRLWTDADNRAFLEEHYPWFLPIYDGYPEAIMRADAIRYFLLDHFGGLYVDMDFECLQSVSGILDGRALVLGCEPDVHTRLLLARRRGFDRIVGNAFIASRPGHPFWTHVHRQLVSAHKLPSTLDATGPFFLTRAVDSAPAADSITVLGPEVLYPKVSPYATELFGPQETDYDSAFAVHHWSDSWAFEKSTPPRMSAGKRFPFWVSQELQPSADGMLSLDTQRRRWASGAPAPTVSCLMVTKDRSATARRAITCFRDQTYRNLELVVVEDGTDDALEQHIRNLGDPRICYHRLPRRGGRWASCATRRWTGPPGPMCASGTTTTCTTRSGSRRRWRRFSRSAPRRASSPGSNCGGRTGASSGSPAHGSGKGRWCVRPTGSRATLRNAGARTPRWRKKWCGPAGS
nr:glycosyltransferase [Streptomyces sp. Tu 2975]